METSPLLGLSAAFDMVDHQAQHPRTASSFDIAGVVLHWFRLCGKGRKTSIQTWHTYTDILTKIFTGCM